ncbi:unnamed protein product, partial [Arabidopsis halleri]
MIRIVLYTYCILESFSGDLELLVSKLEEADQNPQVYSTTRSSAIILASAQSLDHRLLGALHHNTRSPASTCHSTILCNIMLDHNTEATT